MLLVLDARDSRARLTILRSYGDLGAFRQPGSFMCAARAPDLQPSDPELIERIAGGDRQALAALYDRYASSLLGAGMRTLKQRRDAEDVLHDVFVEVWQQAGDYDPMRGSVKAWLFLRMRSRAIDRLRLAGGKETALEGEMEDAMPAHDAE